MLCDRSKGCGWGGLQRGGGCMYAHTEGYSGVAHQSSGSRRAEGGQANLGGLERCWSPLGLGDRYPQVPHPAVAGRGCPWLRGQLCCFHPWHHFAPALLLVRALLIPGWWKLCADLLAFLRPLTQQITFWGAAEDEPVVRAENQIFQCDVVALKGPILCHVTRE